MKDLIAHFLHRVSTFVAAQKGSESLTVGTPDPVPAKIDPPSVLEVSPWIIFGGIFFVSSLGGIAALLRSGQQITGRYVFSAALNSGLIGLVIALVMWSRFGGDDPYLIIGVSVLAGLGGATTIDFLTQYIGKKMGVRQSNPDKAPTKSKLR